jgi:acyl-CoA synthetase (AMP-forming)/AMP-acid ligase II
VSLHPTVSHVKAAQYARAGGPWDVPTLDEALARPTVRIVDGDRRLDAQALDDAINRVVDWLCALGITPGAVVSWQQPNGLETYLLYRACWRVGAIAAPVHRSAGRADVDAVLSQVSPDVVISDPTLPAAAWPGAIALVPGDTSWPPPAPRAGKVTPPRPEDLAVVMFTSGSSGQPKAVMHTHRALVCKARGMIAAHELRPEDVVLMPAPLAHVSGLQNGVFVPGAAGMGTVLMARWDPDTAIDLIEREQVSFMVGPPTFFLGMMAAPRFSTERVASLRLVSSGGSGVTPAFVESASDALAARVKRTYGSTEAPTTTTSGPDDPPERDRSTDGKPMGEMELRVSEPASGAELAVGTIGEVWVRGPEVFVGYIDAAATDAAFAPDGWYRTGDLGFVDDDGWLTITGRMKDIIIRGGENISAAELEAVLEAHPAVSQAVAVGYPDDRLGQRVCAFVVASGSFDLVACRQWMDARGVTRFKWPERVEQVSSLPLLAAGKVDRAALEKQAAADA